MHEQPLHYPAGSVTARGFLAAPDGDDPLPTVVVCHAWAGLTDSERDWARDFAELGYTAVALDVYGEGRVGTTMEEKSGLMRPLVDDRDELQARLQGGLAAVREHARVDASRVACVGFCFGGLCVLDVARTGTDVRGVISVHGLLSPPPTPAADVTAKVLILHGHDDPMVPPEQVLAAEAELTAGGADWQLHTFGGAMHAFTNPDANAPAAGTLYHAPSADRSHRLIETFLDEVLVSA